MTKQEQKIMDFLIEARVLKSKSNAEPLAIDICEKFAYMEEPRDLLYTAITRYLKNVDWFMDASETERIMAGVLAFIWTNVTQEHYSPGYFSPQKEEPKKWWQFWK